MYSMNRATLASFCWLASLFSAIERVWLRVLCRSAVTEPSGSVSYEVDLLSYIPGAPIGALVDHVHRTISIDNTAALSSSSLPAFPRPHSILSHRAPRLFAYSHHGYPYSHIRIIGTLIRVITPNCIPAYPFPWSYG